MDPHPAELVFDPEKLLQKYKKKVEPNTSKFQSFNSFSGDDIVDIDNIGFDLNFEQSLFRSKSEFDLKEAIPDPNNFQTIAYNNSAKKGKAPEDILGTSGGQHLNTFTQHLTFQNLGSLSSQLKNSIANQAQGFVGHTVPPLIMASRFAPLVLPLPHHDLPQNYSQRIRLYGADEDVTSQQHSDRFNDFIDL